VDGLASLLRWPTVYSHLPGGIGFASEASSGLVVVMVGDVCRGKGCFQGCCYWLEALSSLVPAHGISYSKMGSYQMVFTP
jgi:hypothetical protein